MNVTAHPFVATPNYGKCSSCGCRKDSPIHNLEATHDELITLAKRIAHDNAAFIPEEWVSMTQATEHLWGTSGRGNPNCVKVIEACARLGMVEIKTVGKRSRMVRRTPGVPSAEKLWLSPTFDRSSQS